MYVQLKLTPTDQHMTFAVAAAVAHWELNREHQQSSSAATRDYLLCLHSVHISLSVVSMYHTILLRGTPLAAGQVLTANSTSCMNR